MKYEMKEEWRHVNGMKTYIKSAIPVEFEVKILLL